MIGLNFADMTVIVTGAGAGIGRACVSEFAKLGAYIIAIDKDSDGLTHTMEGVRGKAVVMDLCQNTSYKQIESALAEAPHPLKALVNNVGANFKAPTLDLPLEVWNKGLELNLTVALRMCQLAIPHFHKDGSIVNISSTRAFIAGPDILSYVTTKTALIGLSRQLAYDFGTQGIRVNTICPGLILTDRIQARGKSLPDLEQSRCLSRRYGEPEEVARIVAFIASQAASYVQNAVINVDGGQAFDGA